MPATVISHCLQEQTCDAVRQASDGEVGMCGSYLIPSRPRLGLGMTHFIRSMNTLKDQSLHVGDSMNEWMHKQMQALAMPAYLHSTAN